jgi:hypothetical protein
LRGGLDARPGKVAETCNELVLGAGLITRDAHRHSAQAEAGLVLLFAAGARPSAEAVEHAFAQPEQSFEEGSLPPAQTQEVHKRIASRIISQRGRADGWVEVLANGLTFDLAGLEPGPGLTAPGARHFFGLPRNSDSFVFEAISIFPGPHLAGAGAMIPVVRTMAAIASTLARELGALAVCWEPAGSWMDVQYFSRVIAGWSAGGAFPALGLTGIERMHDGGVESDGLAFFVGQELRIESRRGEAPADTVKLATRVIDHLVNNGAILGREALVGPSGEPLMAEPSADGKFLQVWRGG